MRPKSGPGRLRRRITAVLTDDEWEEWLRLTEQLGLVRERRVGRLIAEHLSRLRVWQRMIQSREVARNRR